MSIFRAFNLALFISASLLTQVGRADAQVMGFGNATCQTFSQWDELNKKVATQWMMGYLVSSYMYESRALSNSSYGEQFSDPNFINSGLESAMNSYCKRNPLHTLQQAGNDLVRQLGGALKN